MKAQFAQSNNYQSYLSDLRAVTINTYHALMDLADGRAPDTKTAFAIARMTIGDLRGIPQAHMRDMHGLRKYINTYRSKEAAVTDDGVVTVYGWAEGNSMLLPCCAWHCKTPDYKRRYTPVGLKKMWSNIYNRLEKDSRRRRGIPENAAEKITDEELLKQMEEYTGSIGEHLLAKHRTFTEAVMEERDKGVHTAFRPDTRTDSAAEHTNWGNHTLATVSSDALDNAVHRLLGACLELLMVRRGG